MLVPSRHGPRSDVTLEWADSTPCNFLYFCFSRPFLGLTIWSRRTRKSSCPWTAPTLPKVLLYSRTCVDVIPNTAPAQVQRYLSCHGSVAYQPYKPAILTVARTVCSTRSFQHYYLQTASPQKLLCLVHCIALHSSDYPEEGERLPAAKCEIWVSIRQRVTKKGGGSVPFAVFRLKASCMEDVQ